MIHRKDLVYNFMKVGRKKGMIPWNKGTKGIMKSWNAGTGLKKNCLTCDKKFRAKAVSKYCSTKCFYMSRLGISSWNKGLKMPLISERNKLRVEDRAFNWKGNEVGYRSLHYWVVNHLGQPDACEFCEESGFSGHRIHWANKSQEYKRDLEDWIRLCAKCHKAYDLERRVFS